MSLAVVIAAAVLWVPGPGATVQVQLNGKVHTSVIADVFYVDGAETPKATVDALHEQGAHVACYMSAGSRSATATTPATSPSG